MVKRLTSVRIVPDIALWNLLSEGIFQMYTCKLNSGYLRSIVGGRNKMLFLFWLKLDAQHHSAILDLLFIAGRPNWVLQEALCVTSHQNWPRTAGDKANIKPCSAKLTCKIIITKQHFKERISVHNNRPISAWGKYTEHLLMDKYTMDQWLLPWPVQFQYNLSNLIHLWMSVVCSLSPTDQLENCLEWTQHRWYEVFVDQSVDMD